MPAPFASCCQITQIDVDPLFAPQSGKAITFTPTISPVFVNNGTAWVYVLNVTAQQTTDNAGSTTIYLPYPAITYSPNGTVQWKYMTDSHTLTGTVPTVSGPITLKDLIVTYNWTLS